MDNVKVRFVGGSHFAQFMDAPVMERIEVTFDRPTINVPLRLPIPTAAYTGKDLIGGETRAEFGHRLRRAANEAVRGLEDAILKSLREQGHLV